MAETWPRTLHPLQPSGREKQVFMVHMPIRWTCFALAVCVMGACAVDSEHAPTHHAAQQTAMPSRLETRPLGDSIPEVLGTVVTGTFRGIYIHGFETSHFLHCDDGATGVAGLAGVGMNIFVSGLALTGATRTIGTSIHGLQPMTALLNANVPAMWYGLRVYYVEWHGTIRGPAYRYPSGDLAYLQQVDRVFIARPMRETDCPRANQFARTMPFRVDTAAVIAAAWPAARRHLKSPRVGVLSLSSAMDTWSVPVSSGVVAQLRALKIPVMQPAQKFGSVDSALTHVSSLVAISRRRVRVILTSQWFETDGSMSLQPFGRLEVFVARSDTVDLPCTARYCP